ncbi:MAG: helix-turn-helix domain-containing protein, partial [candidate division NC10 bacterium]|nr:helix-turn-helix domain-containing protein [candidate division NC10 bacterium]
MEGAREARASGLGPGGKREDSVSERATVGSILRERREAKGLTRDQAAEAARIKPVFLQAMEEDDYRFLPDELYVVRFLHEYAAFLGLDATAIRSQFVRQTSHAQAAGTAGLGVKEPVRISLRRLLPVALVLLAAVPVIVIGYSLYTQGGKPAPTPPRPVVAPRAPAAPTEGAAPAPAAPREIQASSAAPREMPAIPAPGPEGHLLRVQATDSASPLTAAGRAGIAGEDVNFKFDDFAVDSPGGAPPASAGVMGLAGLRPLENTPLAADPAFAFRDLYAFPNPARRRERPTIRLQAGLADSVTVRIYDVSGQLVHSADFGGPR